MEAGALIEYPNGVGFGCGENMCVPQGIFRMAAQVHHGKAGALSWHGTGKGFVCLFSFRGAGLWHSECWRPQALQSRAPCLARVSVGMEVG